MTYFLSRSKSAFGVWLAFWSLCLTLLNGPLSAQEVTAEPAADVQSAAVAEPPVAQNGTLSVVVEGLDEPLRDNVLASLDINHFADKPAPEEIRLNWLHRQAEHEIRQALQPFGYFEPIIEAALNRTDSGWEARYRIQPGRPLRVTELDVKVLGEGAQDPLFQNLLANLPLAQGQVLDQPRYEQIKSAMEALATERGYFDARFIERAIRVDLQAYTATIRLHYDTGQRYRFGNITFKQDFLSPELLARYPSFKPDDPYNVYQLLKLQTDLSNSPYFSRVEVNAPPAAGTSAAPVDVELEPGKQRKYSVGVGYGTDTGFRGKLRTEQHWVNRWGHHYEAELGLSQIKSLVGFKYLIPGENPVTDEYAISAGYVQQNDDDKDYHTYKIGGSLQQQDGKWLKNYSLGLQYDEFTIGNRPSTEESLLLIPGLNWTWVDADDRTYPRRGLLFGFGLRGATTALLSDTNFLQGTVQVRWIRALNDDSRLLVRGDLGATVVDDFEKLPTSLRFFTGGDATVRGYSFESIGPSDPDGAVVGGKNLIVASLEYEHRVWKDWGVAAFVDTGDAFDDVDAELKTGVGVGVRWRSPVGPMRLDFASGLDRPPGDTFRFSFSIGPDL
ncbi:MAG: outer membrane protein assembly factor [Gammaproteobacteria bacterium]|nr:outer membrane protein assembly factor [Gammaproteobacteria bacterium]MCP5196058.1 outer membrane protein assembly factor [Gammaproteobacteria bacterium]